MGSPAIDVGDHFTYRHYRTWPEEERWELIEGQAWSMSPAPTRGHQDIQARLITALRNLLKGKSCKAYDAPFDVLLPEADDEIETIVQPDIVGFCDRTKLRDYGAREYWVVDPGNTSIQAWRLKADGGYDKGELRDMIHGPSPIASRILAGFVVDPKELFADLD